MNVVCVAGTFDHIHAGHEALLHRAFSVGQHVLIGLTSDSFVSTYKKTAVRPSNARTQDLINWLGTHGYDGRYEVVLINDPYEPAASDTSLEGLVVSEDSKVRAEEINEKRKARGLKPLALVVAPIYT